MHRLFLAPAVAGTLLLGVTGAATAQPDDDGGLSAQLCAAADLGKVNALLAANVDVDLPAGVRDAVDPTTAAGPLEQVRGALGCAPAEDPDPTTEPPDPGDPTSEAPNPTESQSPTDRPDAALYADCAEARSFGAAPIVEGNPGYRAGLDSDDDGIACEENDPDTAGGSGDDDTLGGTDDSNSGVVNSIPEGSIDTGYVA